MLAVLLATLVFLVSLCGGDGEVDTGSRRRGTVTRDAGEDTVLALEIISAGIVPPGTMWDSAGEMPDDGCIKLAVYPPPGALRTNLLDSNRLHYDAGKLLGITPLDADDTLAMPLNRHLVYIASNRYRHVDELKHSFPYLIPGAAQLLDDICRTFKDSMQARGGGNYRPRVTSLLRTPSSISKLRRVNRASVDSSSHQFGTTFDLSFTRFAYDGGTPHRTQEDMKNLLAEILFKFREDGRCYVIYEPKPGCFHVTLRPQQ